MLKYMRFLALVGMAAGMAMGLAQGQTTPAQDSLPSDIPEKFTANTTSFDYIKRVEMIPMRDGVKLNTVILIPKGAKGAPIILNRTPYNATSKFARNSPNLASIVPYFLDTVAQARYIIVSQDIRGKYKSEGNYVMTRPQVGPLNNSGIDHATDTYDTIDWLVKNLSESNGRVAVMGGSYEGFTSLMATLNPHPALKVSIPFAPMVDGWMGDDWFHNGALRQTGTLDYIYNQQATRAGSEHWWTGRRDEYEDYMAFWSAADMAKSRGIEELGFWKAVSSHPAYDSYWQDQALDKFFAAQPIKVPMMIVSGLFDQEDIYGGPALYRAMAKRPDAAGKLFLTLGPWNHGGGRRAGDAIGPIKFEGETAVWFRRNVMQPFLAHYLTDAPKPDLAPALVYQTGGDQWQKFKSWPQTCVGGCAGKTTPVYLWADGKLDFTKPGSSAGANEADTYISDPAKPIPYLPRPIATTEGENRWGEWLMVDQRFVDGRPDVLTYRGEKLTQPLVLSGEPVAHLYASTTGTDADFVVKLIDVYPEEDINHPVMGGYQLMIAADILRGRYRDDFSKPKAFEPGKIAELNIRLPHVNHVLRPGHRLMVQIQSTWFPLYDRNPQSFVENIFFAKPGDYQAQTHMIYHSANAASAIELPVVKP
jgi:putative CocE/NonD family hydrolase